MSEKLQKCWPAPATAPAGEIEAKIEAGRVSVDGKKSPPLGDRVEIVPWFKNSYRWSSDLGERVCRADLPRAGLL